jgi:hypothetical protein
MLPAISTTQAIEAGLGTGKPSDYLDNEKQASRDSATNVKLEDRLNITELEIVKEAFENCGEEEGVLSREEFEAVLSTTLKGYGGDIQAADLFEKIDLSDEGKINLDQFCSYMLMYYYEKEDKVKSTQVMFTINKAVANYLLNISFRFPNGNQSVWFKTYTKK